MKRLLPLAAFLVVLALSTTAGAQDGPNRAGLVVRHGDGRVLTACVEFSEPAVSGMELLTRAGLDFTTDVQRGSTVCSVDGEGCQFPAESCFCQCQTLGAACTFWIYHHLQDDEWLYSQIGAESYQVTPGSVDGWAWGLGQSDGGIAPPVYTFDRLCAAGPYRARLAQEEAATATADTASGTAGPPPAGVPEEGDAPAPGVTVPPEIPGAAATANPTSGAGAHPSMTESAGAEPPATPAATAAVAVRGENGSTPVAEPPRETPAPRDGGLPASYLAFGAIALVLVVGMVWSRRRSRPAP